MPEIVVLPMASFSGLGVSRAPISHCTLSLDEDPEDATDSVGLLPVVINQQGRFPLWCFHNRLKWTTLGLDQGPRLNLVDEIILFTITQGICHGFCNFGERPSIMVIQPHSISNFQFRHQL